jgi:hypothetical protein
VSRANIVPRISVASCASFRPHVRHWGYISSFPMTAKIFVLAFSSRFHLASLPKKKRIPRIATSFRYTASGYWVVRNAIRSLFQDAFAILSGEKIVTCNSKNSVLLSKMGIPHLGTKWLISAPNRAIVQPGSRFIEGNPGCPVLENLPHSLFIFGPNCQHDYNEAFQPLRVRCSSGRID